MGNSKDPSPFKVRIYSPNFKNDRIKVACELCRLKKKKCDGLRPVCTPCKLRHFRLHSKTRPDQLVENYCKYRIDSEEHDPESGSSQSTVQISLDQISKISARLDSVSRLLFSEPDKLTNAASVLKSVAENLRCLESGETVETAKATFGGVYLESSSQAELADPIKHQHFFIGYWDRSVERILHWPLFEDKFSNVGVINNLMKHDNKHLLENSVHRIKYEDIDISAVETSLMANLSKWIDNYICNVHTSGNLFVDTKSLEKTANSMLSSYSQYNSDRSFLVDYFPETLRASADEKAAEGEGTLPVYIVLLVCSISLISRKYDRESPQSEHFASSLEERQENGKDQLAYELCLIAKRFKTSDECAFYSLWNVQYHLLMSMYKNYMMRPFDAWYHMYQASSLILVYLQENSSVLSPDTKNYQMVQRMYWHCHKNEAEFKLYLSPVYLSSGIINYRPPFSTSDLKIPVYLKSESSIVKDGWAFYLTEVFLKPVFNKTLNLFYLKSNVENKTTPWLIEKRWRSFSQETYVEIIKTSLKETEKLLSIFGKFFSQKDLSTPLRCADERTVRLKENLSVPLLHYISTSVNLPSPQYDNSVSRNEYDSYIHPYLMYFLQDLCDQYLRVPDLVEFACERRHGSWNRLRDIYLSTLVLMILYKLFGIYFFKREKLKQYVANTKKILSYWVDECNEMQQCLEVVEEIYRGLPYIGASSDGS